MNASATYRFGVEKAASEPSSLRRIGYRALGEIHISGRIRLHHVLNTINTLPLAKHGTRVLDAGTGRGDVGLHLARMNPTWQIRGIDIDSENVARCRASAKRLKLPNAQFAHADLVTVDHDSEYDLVVNCDVLEHIDDDGQALRNLVRAVRPGGHLLLTVPADPGRKHLRFLHWIEARRGVATGIEGHVREGYAPETLKRMLVDAGIQPLQIRWTYGFPGTLAHDLFYILGDSQINPFVFALALPILLPLTWAESHIVPKSGCALLAVAKK